MSALFFRNVPGAVIGIVGLFVCGMVGESSASVIAANWINSASKSAVTELNAGRTFVTNFKGADDLTVTQTVGNVNSMYTDHFLSSPGNNPSYLTGYVGTASLGSGDGAIGGLTSLESDFHQSTLFFDFSKPLTSSDKIVIADIDFSEQIQIKAFSLVGSTYVPVSLTGWTEQKFTGMTGVVPNSTWATWDSATGIFTAGISTNLVEPLNVLTPDQNIDRVEFIKFYEAVGASTEIQFLTDTVPEPSTYALLCLSLGVVGFARRKMSKK